MRPDIFLWTLNLLNFTHLELLSPSSLSLRRPPVIAEAFSSSITFLVEDMPYVTGKILHDTKNKRENISFVSQSQYGNFTQHMAQLSLSNTSFMLQNGRCQQSDGKFKNMFGWLPLAHFLRTEKLPPVYENRTCDMWAFELTTVANLSLCVEDNYKPVLFTMNANIHGDPVLESFYFSKDINTTQPPAEDFVPSKNCWVPDPPCANGVNTTILDAFVFHPAHVFDLNNEDVADLLGDAVFICNDANNTDFDHYQWVSRYSIQVWSGWGQYALCNRPSPNQTGVCVGQEKYLVGREAPYGIKPDMCGQCTNNTDVGDWYSLPTAGQCNSSTQVIGPDATKGECTWRIIKKLKTIDGICLLKTNGMLAMCSKEHDYPFIRTSAIMLDSFEFDDPSQGGCPAIA